MTTGLVVVLDGPSSVGKTTTLRALQAAWLISQEAPLVEAGLDAARAALGPVGGGRWADLVDRVEPSIAGRPPVFRYGPLGREMVAGMHRAAAAWARAGLDVVMDHVLIDSAMLTDLRTVMDGVPLLLVGLTCDQVVLDDREVDRDDVVQGRSAAQRAAVLEVEHLHTIDTTAATTAEVVAELLDIVGRFRRG
jgi:chloramphenicol 3-O-phosphotransferase